MDNGEAKGLTIILTGGILMKNFKTFRSAAALMAVAFLAAGCGSDSQTTASSDKNVTVTVGASRSAR